MLLHLNHHLAQNLLALDILHSLFQKVLRSGCSQDDVRKIMHSDIIIAAEPAQHAALGGHHLGNIC